MDSTLVTEKVLQHLKKCMDYHQLKTVIIQINYTIIPFVEGILSFLA